MHWSPCEFSMNVTRGFVVLPSPAIACSLNFTSLSHFPNVNITSHLITRQVHRPNGVGKSSPSCKLNSYMSGMCICELAETRPSTLFALGVLLETHPQAPTVWSTPICCKKHPVLFALPVIVPGDSPCVLWPDVLAILQTTYWWP